MTLEEMQLAVCEKLPKLVDAELNLCMWLPLVKPYNPRSYGALVHWPTEGLQVCHEAEKLLDGEEIFNYDWWLLNGFKADWNHWHRLHATYEQRLEALCRVWFPERFA